MSATTPAIAFPRISLEVLEVLMEELRRRDNLADSRSVEEAAARLTAMEFFAKALQLQMQRGA